MSSSISFDLNVCSEEFVILFGRKRLLACRGGAAFVPFFWHRALLRRRYSRLWVFMKTAGSAFPFTVVLVVVDCGIIGKLLLYLGLQSGHVNTCKLGP
jgi:hypothetical protein